MSGDLHGWSQARSAKFFSPAVGKGAIGCGSQNNSSPVRHSDKANHEVLQFLARVAAVTPIHLADSSVMLHQGQGNFDDRRNKEAAPESAAAQPAMAKD
jgi:hypothetical protein